MTLGAILPHMTLDQPRRFHICDLQRCPRTAKIAEGGIISNHRASHTLDLLLWPRSSATAATPSCCSVEIGTRLLNAPYATSTTKPNTSAAVGARCECASIAEMTWQSAASVLSRRGLRSPKWATESTLFTVARMRAYRTWGRSRPNLRDQPAHSMMHDRLYQQSNRRRGHCETTRRLLDWGVNSILPSCKALAYTYVTSPKAFKYSPCLNISNTSLSSWQR